MPILVCSGSSTTSGTTALRCASLVQINEEDLRELRLARSTRNLTMMDERY